MSEEFVGLVPKEKSRISDLLKGIGLLVFWLVVAALVLGGGYYLARVLLHVDSAIVAATSSTTGIGLLICALVLVVAQGLGTVVRRMDAHAKLLEEQNRYLRYLAQRSREN